MNKAKHIIYTLLLLWNLVFFSICSILGFNYAESESNPYYLIGIIALSSLSFLCIILSGTRGLFKKPLYTLIIPFFVIIAFLIESGTDGVDYFQYFRYFLGFGIPAIFVGAELSNSDSLSSLTKWIDLVMLIVTAGIIVSLPAIVFNSVISVGGASYQQMAYMAAMAFLINLCGILHGDNYQRLGIFNKRYSRVLCFVLLIAQLVCCLYSGGRGGFIMLCFGSAILLFYKNKFSYFIYVILFALALYGISSLYKGTVFYEVIGTRMERTFSFISASGSIDTQNRGEVWDYGFDYIRHNGLLGGGIYKYYKEFRILYDQPYAHNLFLDYLCQGGMPYLIMWMVLLAKFFKKLRLLIRNDSSQLLLLILVVYVFVELMFSNTYLYSGLFWFLLSYVHSWNLKTHETFIQ